MKEHVCHMPERRLARCEDFDIGVEDHGQVCMWGRFSSSNYKQGIGYSPDKNFIKRFLAVFKVDSFKKTHGKICWITACATNIHMIEPPFKGEGEPFDIEQWARELREGSDPY